MSANAAVLLSIATDQRTQYVADTLQSTMVRAEGLGRAVAGALTGAVSVGLCETGAGAVVGVRGAAWSLDQTATGLSQLWSGTPQQTLGGQFITSMAGNGLLGQTLNFAYDTAPPLVVGGVSSCLSETSIASTEVAQTSTLFDQYAAERLAFQNGWEGTAWEGAPIANSPAEVAAMEAPEPIAPIAEASAKGPEATLELALEIQGDVPLRAQTVSLMETAEGPTIATGGAEKGLTAEQQLLAESRGLLAADDFPGEHAEISGAGTAAQQGLVPTRGVTTNAMCSECQSALSSAAQQGGYKLELSADRQSFEFIKEGN
jgi:hypothetical protein